MEQNPTELNVSPAGGYNNIVLLILPVQMQD